MCQLEEDTDEPQRTRSPTIPTRAGELELERYWHVLSRVVSLPQPQGRLATVTKLNLLARPHEAAASSHNLLP